MPVWQEKLPLVGEWEENGLTTLKIRNVIRNARSMLTTPPVTVILRQAKNNRRRRLWRRDRKTRSQPVGETDDSSGATYP